MNAHLIALNQELGISQDTLIARGLHECEEAKYLEVAEQGADGRAYLLAPVAAAAWRNLKTAALHDDIPLLIVSAFRSIERQAEIIRRKLEQGLDIEAILSVCAPPGFSEHHTGRAIDLSTMGDPSLEIKFDQTPAFAWLMERSNAFGFYLSYPLGNPQGYQYEPWHWCFQDTQPAR